MQYSNWKKCCYWNCRRRISENHFLCNEHFNDLIDGFIDQCPVCGRFKNLEYDSCSDCYNERKEYNQVRPHGVLGYQPPAPEVILTTI